MSNDTQTQYAIRSTDATGATKYYKGYRIGTFYISADGLASAHLYASRGAAVAAFNISKRMSRMGDAYWMNALDMWSRAEIVTVEVTFKVVAN